jgi:homoserine O-acetyltransferase/O-succinyltransferase
VQTRPAHGHCEEDGDVRFTARFFVSPFSEDLFFPPEDCQADAAAIPKGEFRPIETPMGHFGMFCLRPEDQQAIDAVIAEVLAA